MSALAKLEAKFHLILAKSPRSDAKIPIIKRKPQNTAVWTSQKSRFLAQGLSVFLCGWWQEQGPPSHPSSIMTVDCDSPLTCDISPVRREAEVETSAWAHYFCIHSMGRSVQGAAGWKRTQSGWPSRGGLVHTAVASYPQHSPSRLSFITLAPLIRVTWEVL